ncbi:MAG TPA: M48 family metallopeptidase [Blastocatellia bacterium]|nr:M48 family metallopeptidase [Blastocatellia bacterium]
MRFKVQGLNKAISTVITLTMLSVSIAAFPHVSDTETKSAPKATEPLKDNENPSKIGSRDINKRTIDFYSLEKETKVGRQLAAEVDQKGKFITDPVITEYINRLGQNIVLHSDAKVPFTIKVIDSADVNAFALPGGFFYINSGAILAADSEAEIVGVMAHEIAHVAARHGVEQASKGALFQYLSIPLIFVGGPLGAIAQNATNILVPLTFLKFSRGAEEEADRLGLQYMWASGYDPTAMLSFFEKLKSKEKKDPSALAKIFSTHPATGDRIEKARDLLVRFPERDEYTISTSEFNLVKQRLLAQINKDLPANTGKAAPTLKRKPANTSSNGNEDGSEKAPPTLKRKPGSEPDND